MRKATIAALAALTLLAFTGCSNDPAQNVTLTEDTIIIDVRTPAEYAEGHLEGATLLDYNAGQLAAELDSLDQNTQYAVYCRSGNRSAQSKRLMEDAGITNVIDLGSVQDAAASTGINIVTD
jgi:rhodanese-related sulfurtransferase